MYPSSNGSTARAGLSTISSLSIVTGLSTPPIPRFNSPPCSIPCSSDVYLADLTVPSELNFGWIRGESAAAKSSKY